MVLSNKKLLSVQHITFPTVSDRHLLHIAINKLIHTTFCDFKLILLIQGDTHIAKA